MTDCTPGPWKVEGSIYNHMVAEIASVASGAERGIAQVWKHNNALADARLLAAAPDMLEALKEIERLSDSIDQSVTLTALLRACRSAIAKAEGAP